MRVIYFDCFAGLSGDMILGAFLDIGVPLEVMRKAWSEVGLKGEIIAQDVYRCHIKGKHIKAELEPERLSFLQMKERIEKSRLSPRVKEISLSALELLKKAEGQIHGKDHDFHEVGDPDTLLDIVGVATAVEFLNPQKILCSPIPLARGEIKTEHGPLPIPAPATLAILEGVPICFSPLKIENVTPTGAALIKAIVQEFRGFPEMKVEKVGYGAGTMDPPEIPNLLRVIWGTSVESEGEIWVLETDLDDLQPEIVPFLEERLREWGALDVVIYANRMKKGRMGVTVRCLVREEKKEALISVLFRESSTLGLRGWKVKRWVLDREILEVLTPYGPVKVKVGKNESEVVNVSPEYESCVSVAREKGVPLKEVYREALLAFQRIFKRAME